MTYKIENEKDNYWEAGFTDDCPLVLEKVGDEFVFLISTANSCNWDWSRHLATKSSDETWEQFFSSFSDTGWEYIPLMRELATLAN